MSQEWNSIETEEKRAQTENRYAGTMEALRQAESALPDFTTSYDGEITRLYEQIVNRPGFHYDIGADPLYRSYRDEAVRGGRLAMRDTMGQAAALTGGYGSSYAQAVGQQQYAAYLQKLGERMPELYAAAYERYQEEGDRLRQQLNAASGLAQAEYGREMDRRNQAAQMEQQSYERRWKSYQNLISLISKSGYEPEDAELAEVGMNRAQAEALRKEYLRANNLPDGSAPTGGAPSYSADPVPVAKSEEKSETGSKEQVKLASINRSKAASKSRK